MPLRAKLTQNILFVLATCIMLPIALHAQKSLSIIAQPTNGCAPLIVKFKPSPMTADTYYWSFGNGNVSSQDTASATYISGGSYTVNLTATTNGIPQTASITVEVFPLPNPNFGAVSGTTSGCAGNFTTEFIDYSTSSGAPIVHWQWDFGDGWGDNNTTGTNPSHPNGSAGDFTVTLVVTDANGCKNDKTIPNFIHASPLPTVSFYADTLKFCTVPANVQFTNGSQGTGMLSYEWDFGDGSPISTATNPAHTYTGFQNYTVTLNVTDQNGCTGNPSTKTVEISEVTAVFNMPDTVCRGDTFHITNYSIGTSQQTWSFGNGSSSLFSPQWFYDVGGHYNITLNASLYGDCPDTYARSIFVESVFADMGPEPWHVCSLHTAVHLIDSTITNNSNGVESWLWTVSPADPSLYYPPALWADTFLVQNPVDTILSTPILDAFLHEIYDVFLEVTTPFGCKDSAYDSIVVYLPTADFMPGPIGGCVPKTISFFNNCSYGSPYDTILSYYWDLGNGTTFSGYEPPPELYNYVGVFNAEITIVTDYGCTVTDFFPIQIGQETFPNFLLLSDDTICASDSAVILNLSQPPLVITSYEVFFNYGSFHYFDGDTLYVNPLDTGWFDFQFNSVHNLCYSDTFTEHLFYVEGPIGFGQALFECPDLFKYTPDSDIVLGFVDYTSFYWDFGDGTFDSTNLNIDLTYGMNVDTFAYIHLFNSNTGCSFTDRMVIIDDVAIAEFTMDSSTTCLGAPITFDPGLSQNMNPFGYAGVAGYYFQWNFDDGAIFNTPFYNTPDLATFGPVTYLFDEPGEYFVQLVIKDFHECDDTIRHRVKIFQPIPVPQVTPPSGCTPVACTFVDLTPADTTLVSWLWSFGQGDSSMLQNPTNIINYVSDSSYQASLTVTDTLGCTGTTEFEVVASTPIPAFSAIAKIVCIGDTVYFNNESVYFSSNPQFTWRFGNGITSNETSPSYLYPQGGLYHVELVLDDAGCKDSLLTHNFILVEDPACEIDSLYYDDQCAPVVVEKMVASSMEFYFTPVWYFGDGMISTAPTPIHTYTETGVYPISLTINTGACPQFHTDTTWLTVYNASADLEVSDDEICLGEEILLSVKNQVDVEGFFVDFGDGTPFGTENQNLHQYNIASEANSLEAILYYWNGECPWTDSHILDIYDVRANFLRGPDDEDYEDCYSITVDLIDQSLGANSWYWDFGDGIVSHNRNETHTFNSPGTYEVLHMVQNSQYDCEVEVVKTIWVYPAPTIITDTYYEICPGDSVQLDAAGGITYQWSPGTFLSETNIPNPMSKPGYTIDYTLHVTDEKTCENEEEVRIFVQANPFYTLGDTTIIVGDILTVNGDPLWNVEYVWSPNYNLQNPNDYNPGFQPLVDTTYVVTMTASADGRICFVNTDTLDITVDWKFNVDVPDLFTPNGDGNNDVVFAKGWGIRKILEFRIFNRWGEMVFYTDDITQGWDGMYKGMPQPIDTYVYMVKVDFYDDSINVIKGTLNLMR
ncbi:MAG: PKD domain-containing protein [Bacteroidales bacterium]|nr:PKD domain-containing protein [Bacteroidales bacterium]MCF8456110.1 PKD domain-containing protein [Bacteroidales bacterium]